MRRTKRKVKETLAITFVVGIILIVLLLAKIFSPEVILGWIGDNLVGLIVGFSIHAAGGILTSFLLDDRETSLRIVEE